MDAFHIIQNFFTRMHCNFCSQSFEPDDIQLLRQEDGLFIVNVFCNRCGTQNGVALVGMNGMNGQEQGADLQAPYFEDPELTPEECQRLAEFEPINQDDVLDVHNFLKQLGSDWERHIPAEMRHFKNEVR